MRLMALILVSKLNFLVSGNFELRDKRQRPGRNPKNRTKIPISARRVVTFRTRAEIPPTRLD